MMENLLMIKQSKDDGELIGGDKTSGFYGEVHVNDFITGDTLAARL